MDPITATAGLTLTDVAIGGSAAGGVMGAIGKFFGGEADKSMYDYQAQVAMVNKQIAEQNAEYAREVGEVQAQKSGMETRGKIGTTIAKQSGSGLLVGTGSNAKIVESEKALGVYDESLIRANAAKRAYGYEVEAMNQDVQAQIDKMAGSKSETAGIIGGIGSLIGTAGSVSTKWLEGSQKGLWGSGSGGGEGD